MSRIKEFYFEEINRINETDNMIDEKYQQLMVEDEFFENYFEKNKERFEAERIFNLTNTYPF
jgi:hypothetical protein